MLIPQKPRFRGKLSYPPGPHGLALPVAGARVRIWDTDIGGGDDLLVDATTTSSGRFNKQAVKNWQDKKKIPLGFGRTTTIPDPLDIPIFVIQIDDPATGSTMKVPFAYISDTIELPMIVTWFPATPDPASDGGIFGAIAVSAGTVMSSLGTLMTINGRDVKIGQNSEIVWEYIKDDAERGKKVVIKFGAALSAGAFMLPFKDNKLDYDELRELVCDLLGLDKASSVLSVNPGVDELAMIALIIFILSVASPLAIGSATFMVIMGLAIFLAVVLGFRVEVQKIDTASTGSGNSTPIPLSDLTIVLVPPTR